MFKNYADVNTPITKESWNNLTDKERFDMVNNEVNNSSFNSINVVSAQKNGQILVTLIDQVMADKRGNLLLDFEEHLKSTIDEGLNVWCEPLGDKSSLRNLRGIEIKS